MGAAGWFRGVSSFGDDALNLLERNEVMRAYLRGLSVWDRGHAERVAVYSVATAVELKVPSRQLPTIRYAATLCGLLPDETSLDLHPQPLPPPSGTYIRLQEEGALIRLPFLRAAGKILGAFRERCDGSGGPLGLSREEIPLAARIVGACEVFDRMANGTPGEDPWATLQSPAFDPEVVAALRRVADLIQPIGT